MATKPGMIATRNGKPAYLDAPPRLRQSSIKRQPLPESKPRWWKRITGKE